MRTVAYYLLILFAPIISFFIPRGSTYCQVMKFDQLSVNDGLSQGNIFDIIQDTYGFMWIGSEDGLNRYDGYSFKVYRNDPDDSTSLVSSGIQSLSEDTLGNVWIGTQAGVNIYLRELDRLVLVKTEAADQQALAPGATNSILQDRQGNMWVGAGTILHLYNYKTQKFVRYNPELGEINDLVEDKQGRIWVGTSYGLGVLSKDRHSFEHFFHDDSNPNSLSSNDIRSLAVEDDIIWIGTFETGVDQFHFSDEKFTNFQYHTANGLIPSNYIRDINIDEKGKTWIATDNGLSILNSDRATYSIYQENGEDMGLKSNIISKICFDANGGAWLGTRYAGVHVFNESLYQFEHFKHNATNHSLNNNTVTCFAEDALGNIYVGTDGGGINYYNRKTNQFQYIRHDPDNPNSLTNDKVLALEMDQNEILWVGMWAGGINSYDPKTKKITRYTSDPNNTNSLSGMNIFDIMEDSKGNLWVGTWGSGLTKYDPRNKQFTKYMYNPNDPNSIEDGDIVFLMEDQFGKIWIATENKGVFVLDPEMEEFKTYTSSEEKGSLSYHATYSLFEDSKNRIWIGTTSAGLNLFDPKTETFTVFRKKDGLPNDGITGILEDDSHNLWLSTNKGLCKFNPDDLTFKNFDEKDGLQGDQFNRWAFYKLSTGELLFGGNNGFNLFNPKRIKPNNSIPPIYITGFKLFNQEAPIGDSEVLKKSIMLTESLELDYSQNVFTFEYVALNYRQTEKNRYEYKLEGFDKDWIATIDRKAIYTNLSPGKYIFRVRASNNDGVWNEQGASVKITVVPPFWRTAWFIILATISVTGGAFLYIRRQRTKAHQQKIELERIIEEQTSEVKKKSDEILEKVKKEEVTNWITKGLAHFGDVMSKSKNSLEELTHEVLKNLVRQVEATQGTLALGVKNNLNDEHLEIKATFGVDNDRLKTKRIEVGEGLMGGVYKDKEIILLENIPSDYVKIESGLGSITPNNLVILPLKTDDGEAHGVIELAFFGKIPETKMQFLKEVTASIALNIHATNLNYQTSQLLERSQEKTKAMEEEFKRKELRIQSDYNELKEAFDECRQKACILEEELKKLNLEK